MVSGSEQEEMQQRACAFLRDEKVQEQLSHLLVSYLTIVQPIVNVATVENNGIRPEGLENEIYSCFHHIARGLCLKESRDEVAVEISKAEDSHLKRLLLDSYKVALRPRMEAYRFVINDLYSLSLDKDFNSDLYGPDSVKGVCNLLKTADGIKDTYKAAKDFEAIGDTGRAIEAFEQALADCYLLANDIQEVMKESVFLIAQAHAAQKAQKEQEKWDETKCHNRWTRCIAFFSLVVSIIVVIVQIYCK